MSNLLRGSGKWKRCSFPTVVASLALLLLALPATGQGKVNKKANATLDSINAVWLTGVPMKEKKKSSDPDGLYEERRSFRSTTGCEVKVSSSITPEPTGLTQMVVELWQSFWSLFEEAKNVIAIDLFWRQTAEGWSLDKVEVKPDVVKGQFPDEAVQAFHDTITSHREANLRLKADVRVYKKIAAELQTLKKQVKGVTVTIDSLKKVFPNVSAEVVEALNKHSAEFGITTPDRMAHFLGQIGAETDGLQKLTESYNYSAKQIYDIFLKRVLLSSSNSTTEKTFKYCDLIDGIFCISLTSCPGSNKGHSGCDSVINVPYDANEECTWDYAGFLKSDKTKAAYAVKTSYVGNSTLFDYTYGCRMGNGAKSTKDGSTYLGKGFIHLTGKEQYMTVSNEWNKLYPNDKKEFHGKDINLLETDVDVAMKVSMIYWEMKKLNNLSDKGLDQNSIDAVGKIINGSGKNLPNGYKQRRDYTKNVSNQLK
ncbi:MAG: hypothetical protein LBK47_09535 [Prevotellaceae bacterium]|nr:hypothetical protein [Prevotellaceae bacterium]